MESTFLIFTVKQKYFSDPDLKLHTIKKSHGIVISQAIIRIPVRSKNQGQQISHLRLNSNYETVFLKWDEYGAKLPTPDIL